jgi:hypothetical protein
LIDFHPEHSFFRFSNFNQSDARPKARGSRPPCSDRANSSRTPAACSSGPCFEDDVKRSLARAPHPAEPG